MYIRTIVTRHLSVAPLPLFLFNHFDQYNKLSTWTKLPFFTENKPQNTFFSSVCLSVRVSVTAADSGLEKSRMKKIENNFTTITLSLNYILKYKITSTSCEFRLTFLIFWSSLVNLFTEIYLIKSIISDFICQFIL